MYLIPILPKNINFTLPTHIFLKKHIYFTNKPKRWGYGCGLKH
nr:MAG TPA: hypothetical protein [Caudoviricetes sp.]